jgi:hypothetical protein
MENPLIRAAFSPPLSDSLINLFHQLLTDIKYGLRYGRESIALRILCGFLVIHD